MSAGELHFLHESCCVIKDANAPLMKFGQLSYTTYFKPYMATAMFRMSHLRIYSSIACQDVFAAVLWLSVQPLVHFISPVSRTEVTNIYASLISQSGGLFGTADVDPTAPVFTPFIRMGLDGTGQV
jgi:hypothetical protein